MREKLLVGLAVIIAIGVGILLYGEVRLFKNPTFNGPPAGRPHDGDDDSDRPPIIVSDGTLDFQARDTNGDNGHWRELKVGAWFIYLHIHHRHPPAVLDIEVLDTKGATCSEGTTSEALPFPITLQPTEEMILTSSDGVLTHPHRVLNLGGVIVLSQTKEESADAMPTLSLDDSNYLSTLAVVSQNILCKFPKPQANIDVLKICQHASSSSCQYP